MLGFFHCRALPAECDALKEKHDELHVRVTGQWNEMVQVSHFIVCFMQ